MLVFEVSNIKSLEEDILNPSVICQSYSCEVRFGKVNRMRTNNLHS